MSMRRYAILAVLTLAGLVALASAGPQEVPPDSPRPVRFRLADGVQIAGELESWDDEGLDGSFGRRRWVDLMVRDAWTLRRRLMNRESAGQWVALAKRDVVGQTLGGASERDGVVIVSGESYKAVRDIVIKVPALLRQTPAVLFIPKASPLP